MTLTRTLRIERTAGVCARFAVVCATLALLACEAGSGGTGAAEDAGTFDATVTRDAGDTSDAGVTPDASREPDAGVTDSGSAPEPDAAVDAGAPTRTCDFTPCGGDLLGTWSLDYACLNGVKAILRAMCPDVEIEAEPDPSGDIVFEDDGSFTFMAELIGPFRYTLPSECISSETSDCSELATGSQTCSGDPSVSCTCTDETEDKTDQEGTYVTDGNTVTLDPSGGATEDADYCVDGTSLWLEGGGVLFHATRS